MSAPLAPRRVALVTAASRGLGAACAANFAAQGHRVLICARQAASLHVTTETLRLRVGDAAVASHACDLTDASAPDALAAASLQAFGQTPDIVVCNAGGPPPGAFTSLSDDAWQQAFALSFLTTARLIRRFAPDMQARRWGRLITITSATVLRPLDGLTLSNVVRPAVLALIRELAPQLAPFGVTLNNVAPGYTRTDRVEALISAQAAREGVSPDAVRAARVAAIPAGRMGEADELAAAVAYFASESAGFVTGQTLAVDGGFSV